MRNKTKEEKKLRALFDFSKMVCQEVGAVFPYNSYEEWLQARQQKENTKQHYNEKDK